LRFGSYWIQVDGPDLLVNIGNGECSILLQHNNSDFWLLGFGFLRNYYTSLDFDKKVIQIAPSNKSLKPVPYVTEAGATEIWVGIVKSDLTPFHIALICQGTLLLCLVVFGLVFVNTTLPWLKKQEQIKYK